MYLWPKKVLPNKKIKPLPTVNITKFVIGSKQKQTKKVLFCFVCIKSLLKLDLRLNSKQLLRKTFSFAGFYFMSKWVRSKQKELLIFFTNLWMEKLLFFWNKVYFIVKFFICGSVVITNSCYARGWGCNLGWAGFLWPQSSYKEFI